MEVIQKSLLFVLFFVLLNGCDTDPTNQDPDPDPDLIVQEDLSGVDERVKAFMDQYDIPGASIAVSNDEKMVYAKGYGLANIASQEPVTTNSVFRVASISKMFTGVSILKLVENNMLSLDDKVFGPNGILGDDFGSATPTDQELQITIDHLLHNSFGGWGVASGGDPIDYVPEYENDAFIEYILNDWDLTYPIEETYVYSNTGYWLLARIIEEVSGQNFSDYVQDLFSMADITTLHYTTFREEDRQPNEVEYFGQNGEDQWIYTIASRRDGDAAVVISAPDLLRAVCALDKSDDREDVLSPTTIELLRGNGPLAPNWGRGIGFSNGGYWWTTGSLPATRSWLLSTYSGLSVVVILNSKSTETSFDSDFNQLLWDIVQDSSIPWKEGLDQF